jgi:hypothetical protein
LDLKSLNLSAAHCSSSMTKPISPAAQAVASAYDDTPEKDTGNHRYFWLAAALRAAAKLEDIKPGFIGPCDESYGSCLPVRLFTERDLNYSLALEKNRAQVAAQRKLLAIAAELEGGND